MNEFTKPLRKASREENKLQAYYWSLRSIFTLTLISTLLLPLERVKSRNSVDVKFLPLSNLVEFRKATDNPGLCFISDRWILVLFQFHAPCERFRYSHRRFFNEEIISSFVPGRHCSYLIFAHYFTSGSIGLTWDLSDGCLVLLMYRSNQSFNMPPPPGIWHLCRPGRREFDYQSVPGGGEFDPHALGVGDLNCTLDFM